MKRILIVEDNENNMYLISFILKKKGYTILQAGSGEEGVDLAAREKPDMIIMDIQLPGIDGLEATRRMRESGVSGNVPIIALTSYAMAGDREKAIASGCTGYIEKPINPETFTEELGKYLTQGDKHESSDC
jgi:two-component system, cell cycle response regulator DivK